jgi:hypothetical protein
VVPPLALAPPLPSRPPVVAVALLVVPWVPPLEPPTAGAPPEPVLPPLPPQAPASTSMAKLTRLPDDAYLGRPRFVPSMVCLQTTV